MPKSAESPLFKRAQVPYATALERVEALYDLGEVGLAFDGKSEKEMQQTLHEWSCAVYDLAVWFVPRKEGDRAALDEVKDLGSTLALRLRTYFAARYGWRTGDKIADRFKAFFPPKPKKLRENDLERWAACFVSEAADEEAGPESALKQETFTIFCKMTKRSGESSLTTDAGTVGVEPAKEALSFLEWARTQGVVGGITESTMSSKTGDEEYCLQGKYALQGT